MRSQLRGLKAPDGGETKVVELGGASVQIGLRRGDPFRRLGDPCPFPTECLADGRTNCEQQRVVYRLQCMVCKDQGQETTYLGTTGHTFHKRSQEHLYDLTHGAMKNPIARHFSNTHPEIDVRERGGWVTGSVVGNTSFQYNLDRFLREALEIEEGSKNQGVQMLNGRGELGRVSLHRITLTQQ